MEHTKENTMDACDTPLLELHLQISSVWYDRKRLREENSKLQNSHAELVAAQKKLNALETMGVDNWDGYDEAMEMLAKELGKAQDIS